MTYGYDATASGNEGVGRLTSITDESGSTDVVYDLRGSLTQETRTIGGVAYTTAYAYDLADRVTEITYPSGRIVSYTRDSLGRVTGVTSKENSGATAVAVASSITYRPFGPLAGLTHGNGLTLTRGHDLDYRLSAIATTDGLTPVQDLAYGYDAADGVISITDNLATARSQTFGYDNRRRLSDATGAYGDIDYGYDSAGNRTSRVTNDGVVTITITDTYTVALDSNRLSSVSDGSTTRSLSYNAAGAVITDDKGTGTVLTHGTNGENRLASVSQGVTTLATHTHNAKGERVIKVAGSTTTHYHYDQAGRLIAESDGSGTVQREYIRLGGLPLAVVDHTGTSPVLHHVHADHLGTPQKMTDGSKAVVWDAVLKPFGEMHSLTATAANDNRFPGQRLEAETGLHYNYFRDYDPSLGRYTQSDPIGLEGGLNTYAYVFSDPANLIDPEGLEAVFGEFGNSNECRATPEDVLAGVAGTLAPVCLVVPGLCARIGAKATARLFGKKLVGKSLDDLLKSATRTTTGKTRQFEKRGGFNQANKDFDDLVGGRPVKEHGNGIRSGTLKDGSSVSVRPGSNQGSPTVQINPKTGKAIKIRYGD